MKQNMFNTIKDMFRPAVCFLLPLVGGGLVGVSCSDWTDHYDADTAILDTQHQTLWDNIASTSNLSQFKALLQKAGYDKVLDNTQTYTVWAPADGTFDYERLAAYSDSRLKREFIENHIARNNYVATGDLQQKPLNIYTLNEKLMSFSGSGQYAIQDVGIGRPNVAGSNGTMHLLDGMIPFRANIYESLNNLDHPIDSVADFYHSYDERELDKFKSVQGPMVDGKITYLDSIFEERNDLYSYFYAYINREDSNYTMLVPTNVAWTKAKEQISKYYRYLPSFQFMKNTLDAKSEAVTINDVDSLYNVVVNGMLMRDLFYNNNLYDNKKLNTLQTGGRLNVDSLYSTTYTKVYSEDAANMFEGAVRYNKSNGAIWVTDSLRIHPWHSWNPEIIIQAENSANVSSVENVFEDRYQTTYVTPGTQNPEVSGHVSNNAYIELPPQSGINPGVTFYLPNVRSTTYSVYVVTVPANIVSSNFESKPYSFEVSMGYATETGAMKDKDKSWVANSVFVSDTLSVDTIYLGDFTFPVAYYGTGSYYPHLRITSRVTGRQKNNYDLNLRIDCVILRPKELDDYLKEHPDYMYDRGNY